MKTVLLQLTISFLCLLPIGAYSRCLYTAGDVNGNLTTNGLDVIYAVNYLKGIGPAPPDSCDCQQYGMIYSAADANGNCEFNGLDIIYTVNYLKGIGPAPQGCPSCPPSMSDPYEWNMSDEYSSENNPTGPWSYGRKWSPDGGTFDLFTYRWGNSGWYLGNVGHGGPSIQAGPDLWAKDNSNGLPCVRWACPDSGFYSVNSTFIGWDSRGVSAITFVVVNNAIKFSAPLIANGDSTNYMSDYFYLNQGENIEFLIRWNYGVYSEYSWTLVHALIDRF
jgi:hypothetical protein